MNPFRDDNTEGYTLEQLAELNRRFDLAAVSHLAQSIYDEEGTLDFDRWEADDNSDYKSIVEGVQREFDSIGGAR